VVMEFSTRTASLPVNRVEQQPGSGTRLRGGGIRHQDGFVACGSADLSYIYLLVCQLHTLESLPLWCASCRCTKIPCDSHVLVNEKYSLTKPR